MFNAQRKLKNPTKLQFTIGFFVVVALLWGVRYLTRSTPQDIARASRLSLPNVGAYVLCKTAKTPRNAKRNWYMSAKVHTGMLTAYPAPFPISYRVPPRCCRILARPSTTASTIRAFPSTSCILRSMDDVAKLQRHNPNATERSCHLFGTTIDICYNRYHPVTRPVRDDTLKWVLSEVLRDKHNEGRCYIKYEVKQGCFHMTVR